MGEMADDLIDGACCNLCGCYFEGDHGYPVVCKDCWNNLNSKERKDFQKATNKEA